MVHSAGHNLPIMNNNNDTSVNVMNKLIHTSSANGDTNENKLGGFLVGFLYNILIPRIEMELIVINHFTVIIYLLFIYLLLPKFINGIVKSTAFSRSAVIVKSVIARSPSLNN